MRLDQILVKKGLVKSRSQAQQLIEQGKVQLKIADQISVKNSPGQQFDVDNIQDIILLESDLTRFVSRAGLKLESALEHLKLDVTNFAALDVGISTGGFTDCLLQRGAQQVCGVEVGHGQTDAKIAQDSRVLLFEGMNARALKSNPEFNAKIKTEYFDLIVMDVSFISTKLIFSELTEYLKKGGYILSLIKPQFELGPESLNKNGIVKDSSLYPVLERNIVSELSSLRMSVLDWFESALPGKDGNREFFVFAKKSES